MTSFTFEQEIGGGSFFLLEDDVKIGEVTFRKKGAEEIVINHTYVKKNREGNGYGKKLVEKVLEYAKENNLKVSASCWFAEKLIESKTNG